MKKFIILGFALLMLSARLPAQNRVTATLSAAGANCLITNVCQILPITPQVGGVTFTVSANASGNTLQFEATANGGTTWVALNATPSNSTTAATSTTSTGTWQANVAGYTAVRIRMSTLAGGTSTVTLSTSTASARAGGGGSGGGTLNCTTTGGIAFENGTANTLTCSPTLIRDTAGGVSAIVESADGLGVTQITDDGGGIGEFLEENDAATQESTLLFNANTQTVSTSNFGNVGNAQFVMHTDTGQTCWLGSTSGSTCLTTPATGGILNSDSPVTATSVATGTSPPTCTVGTAGAFCANEGTAPTGASSVDDLYANSTTHCLDAINNNLEQGCVATLPATPSAVTLGSGTSLSAASLCTTAVCTAGTYQINVFIDVTTACATTGTYIVWLGWTDDQGAKTGSSTTTFIPIQGTGATTSSGSLALASTNNYGQGTFTLRTTGAATGGLGSINFGTTSTACGSGGPAVGKIYLTVTRLSTL